MYLQQIIDLGYLTDEPIRKHPLRPSSLAHIVKAYALTKNLPYRINNQDYSEFEPYTLYLTDIGLDWLLGVFPNYSLPFLRSTFPYLFAKASEEDVADPNYAWYRNFHGTSGVKLPAGSKQRAVLVYTRKRFKREIEFDSLYEARQYIKTLSRFQSLEGYELYRIRKNTRKGKVTYFRNKVDLIPPPRKNMLK